MQDIPFNVYVPNLPSRRERKENIHHEFKNRGEFHLNVVPAFEHTIGAIGLWKTIEYILRGLVSKEEDFIILCEDDHHFEESYNCHFLIEKIKEAQEKDADILSGGISWFTDAIQISKDLFWVEKFSGLQFTVIFKKFYDKILSADFVAGDAADYKISSLTENKFVIYPFISTQKEFGYSDVTNSNNEVGYISRIFKECSRRFEILKKVSNFYRRKSQVVINERGYENIIIPTYIINPKSEVEGLNHIQMEFINKPEFNIQVIETCKHVIGPVGLWNSIIKIIKTAIENEDEVIIICEDGHQFTAHYSREYLISNILRASMQDVEILSGGIGGFKHAVPVTKNRYWINSFQCSQFTILYKSIFKKILNEPFQDTDTADSILSKISSHKMTLYPFISVQKDFGYSDVGLFNKKTSELITQKFKDTNTRLNKYKEVYEKYVERVNNLSV